MAYGSDETGVACATTDEWLNEGENGINLMASQDPFMAILYDNSLEPGGDWQFEQGTPAEGNKFKYTVYGKGPGNARGVGRASQTTGYSAAIGDPATNVYWQWAHYESYCNWNYEDESKNSGKAKMVDLGRLIVDSLVSEMFQLMGYHFWDQQAGTDRHIQSVTQALLNTGTVAGIDQTDTTNNAWWNAQHNSDSEALSAVMFSQLISDCQVDTPVGNGIAQNYADVGFVPRGHYAVIKDTWLRPSQRQEVNVMARGGARYIVFDGVRIFRNTKFRTSVYGTDTGAGGTVTVAYPMTENSATDRGVILNSRTWGFRYKTKMPDPVTPDFIPVSGKPSMKERGYNWMAGLGCKSVKHNAMYSNKT